MYCNTDVSIKQSGDLTESFKSNTGIMQGCVMNPTLFDIFICILPNFLQEDDCNPVKLYDMFITCLPFVDDIVFSFFLEMNLFKKKKLYTSQSS